MKRISPFATQRMCRVCNGHRLKKEYLAVLVGGKNIGELTEFSVEDSRIFFDKISFSSEEKQIVV